MSSAARIRANRRNARKSTGPRTQAGKSVSRMNALKSGIYAQSFVIPGEDPAALTQLSADYAAEFRPITPRQRDLVDALVRNEWLIRRLHRLEADMWTQQFETNAAMFRNPEVAAHLHIQRHPLATAFDDIQTRLEALQRWLHAYERATERVWHQLRTLQREETEEDDSIGFVPSDSSAAQPATVPCSSPAPDPPSPAPEPPSPSPIRAILDPQEGSPCSV